MYPTRLPFGKRRSNQDPKTRNHKSPAQAQVSQCRRTVRSRCPECALSEAQSRRFLPALFPEWRTARLVPSRFLSILGCHFQRCNLIPYPIHHPLPAHIPNCADANNIVLPLLHVEKVAGGHNRTRWQMGKGLDRAVNLWFTDLDIIFRSCVRLFGEERSRIRY